MRSETVLQVLAVVSPFVAGYFTYLFTQRSKKTEYLYQYRLPAFREVFKCVASVKRFAEGQVALSLGAEFSPFFDEPGSPLSLRTELAKVREENDIFLTRNSRKILDKLDSQLGIFCNAVIAQKNTDGTERHSIDYEPLRQLTNKVQMLMYEEIDLPEK